ncbi:metal-dependent hydrolase [Lusitaniella coriacea]|uniref:metal-dependent hydrolase n=1 Tax=Lusitaniella coriacea TaxID=1983105 RepID=UPI003CF417EC
MSSPVGHSLAAAIIYFSRNKFNSKLWLVWLVVLASIPDLDYVVPFLNRANYYNARVTHSFGFSLLLPFCTIFGLFLAGNRGKTLRILGLQAIAAGLSHLVLDLFVGVTPLPLFFPFNSHLFKLPFGILPSSWTPEPKQYFPWFQQLFQILPSSWMPNSKTYFLCRQILIELGILLPWIWMSWVCARNRIESLRDRAILKITLSLLISLACTIWAWSLPR